MAVVVDAVDDDAVLAPAHEGQPPAGEPAEVSGPEPAVRRERGLGRVLVVPVAARDHRARELYLADFAVGERCDAVLFRDPDAQAVERPSDRRELGSAVGVGELPVVDAAGAGLGHPEGGPERAAVQPVRGEPLQEADARDDGVGLTARDDVPQAGEVQGRRGGRLVERLVDQPEQEVGGEGHRHPVGVDQLQEEHRVGQHRLGPDLQLDGSHGQREEVCLQQCGDVVVGDPVERHVVRGERLRLGLRGHRGQEVGVGEPDRLGRAGGTGGEDQQRHLVRAGPGHGHGARVRAGRGQDQVLDRGDRQPLDGGKRLAGPAVGDQERPVEQGVDVAQLRCPALRVVPDGNQRADGDPAQLAGPEGRDEVLGPLQQQRHDPAGANTRLP